MQHVALSKTNTLSIGLCYLRKFFLISAAHSTRFESRFETEKPSRGPQTKQTAEFREKTSREKRVEFC